MTTEYAQDELHAVDTSQCTLQLLPTDRVPGLLVTLDLNGNWTARSPYKQARNEVVAEGHASSIAELVRDIWEHSDW